jgi:hypothetical protein
MTAIPIGLDYHTVARWNAWGERAASPADQEAQLILLREKSIPFWERTNKCYSNFQFQMQTRFGLDRRNAIQQISKELVFYEQKPVRRSLTWARQSDFAFVLSPHGNGYDCHRLWEALILGCIPIVRTSCLDDLYEDLPVLIVSEWSDITKELLEDTIEVFKERHEENLFNYDKLTLKYWMDKINSYKIPLPPFSRSYEKVLRSEEPNEETNDEDESNDDETNEDETNEDETN